MQFMSVIKEVKAKTDGRGKKYVEMKLDAIRCEDVDLEEAKQLLGKAVKVTIETSQQPLMG